MACMQALKNASRPDANFVVTDSICGFHNKQPLTASNTNFDERAGVMTTRGCSECLENEKKKHDDIII